VKKKNEAESLGSVYLLKKKGEMKMADYYECGDCGFQATYALVKHHENLDEENYDEAIKKSVRAKWKKRKIGCLVCEECGGPVSFFLDN